jgi:hypothetical protein
MFPLSPASGERDGVRGREDASFNYRDVKSA